MKTFQIQGEKEDVLAIIKRIAKEFPGMTIEEYLESRKTKELKLQ